MDLQEPQNNANIPPVEENQSVGHRIQYPEVSLKPEVVVIEISDQLPINIPINNSNNLNESAIKIEASPLQQVKSEQTIKREKSKKRKIRQYITDFSDFLPESLITINRTVIHSRVRIGNRYQSQIEKYPILKQLYRPMNQWLIWDGSNHPQKQPSEQCMLQFKELLGQNRNAEELISMRERLQMNSWRQVLEYANNNKSDLRRMFHMAQRNRI